MKIFNEDYFYKRIVPYSKDDLKKFVQIKKYKSFEIPKKGGSRSITYLEETDSLYICQKALVKNMFSDEPLPICVKGFVKGGSYRKYLEPHIGNKYFLRVDIHDFFGSISQNKIKKMLEELILISNKDDKDELIDLISEILSFEDKLPQGAVSSPIVSNLCFRYLDQRITKYCQKLNIHYTRYADDLLFSSLYYNFEEKKWFLRKIREILRSDGYKLNYSKIKYAVDELSLNGFIIDNDTIRISRKRLKDVKRILYFIFENQNTIIDENDFIIRINSIPLIYRRNEFISYNHVVQYINGYRALLISFIDDWNSEHDNQKELKRIINKCQKCVNIIYSKKAGTS